MNFANPTIATDEISSYELERNKPMPSLNHGAIQANLIIELAPFRKKYRLASELSIDLSDWPSVPDISIFPKMELDMKQDIISMKEPPLGVIEILSPSQSLAELTTKASSYFAHGVKSCWIVLPSLSNIYVFSSPDDYAIFRASETLHDEVLDITFSLGEVFK
ncbi:MAG TPA: Uma2 family endonuclease [Saprospiraceae bacterium]|nr:Uma2 family endonuclease [Saprospiraceae bacterium]HMQ84941.1 Uma2 family endonuclease [Saprospiraceae bacterium]